MHENVHPSILKLKAKLIDRSVLTSTEDTQSTVNNERTD